MCRTQNLYILLKSHLAKSGLLWKRNSRQLKSSNFKFYWPLNFCLIFQISQNRWSFWRFFFFHFLLELLVNPIQENYSIGQRLIWIFIPDTLQVKFWALVIFFRNFRFKNNTVDYLVARRSTVVGWYITYCSSPSSWQSTESPRANCSVLSWMLMTLHLAWIPWTTNF